MELISEDSLDRLPQTRDYLLGHEATLRGRERGRMDHDGWWAYTYPKSLGLHDSPKLGVAATVKRLEVAADARGVTYFHNVRVNGIIPEDGTSIWPLLALMNSRLIDFVFRRGAAVHANGYFAANKQFIAPLPIRAPEDEHGATLCELGERRHERATAISVERDGFHRWLGGVLGQDPSTLPGRGRILAYEEAGFDDWLAALRRGARDRHIGIGGRAFREQAEAEWTSSVARLADLRAAQAGDEASADQMFFDLYEMPENLRRVVNAEFE
jgi:hypothetical protein